MMFWVAQKEIRNTTIWTGTMYYTTYVYCISFTYVCCKQFAALTVRDARTCTYIYIWMFPKIVGVPPKSSILIGFSIPNHPIWGTPIFWKHHETPIFTHIFEVTTSFANFQQKYHGVWLHPGSSTWIVVSAYTVYIKHINIYIYIYIYKI